ncbi:hypothetical protein JCM11251_002518 [Rhodosporidiobolus azoricus]
MFIPGPWSFFTWICTVKGWVVLQSAVLAGGYLAVAWALRRVAFPRLKGIFENEALYNFVPPLREPLLTWIADVKDLFYGALAYFAMGFAGLVGAVLQIGILLVPHAVYLLISWFAAAYKIWTVLQTILKSWDDLGKACNKASSFFGQGSCDETFDKYKQQAQAGAGVLTFLQATTLICVIVLIRRNKKKTGSYFFTFCGHPCGRRNRKSKENDLEKGIPVGRRRRGASRTLLQEKVAALPSAEFSLSRRAERRRTVEKETATFELGSRSRFADRRATFITAEERTTSLPSTSESDSDPPSPPLRRHEDAIELRSLRKKERKRRKRRDAWRKEGEFEPGTDETRPGFTSDLSGSYMSDSTDARRRSSSIGGRHWA